MEALTEGHTVANRNKEAGLAVVDHLRNGADWGTDYRSSACHCLKDDPGRKVGCSWQDNHRRLGVERS
jgi:hypothetical protein